MMLQAMTPGGRAETGARPRRRVRSLTASTPPSTDVTLSWDAQPSERSYEAVGLRNHPRLLREA